MKAVPVYVLTGDKSHGLIDQPVLRKLVEQRGIQLRPIKQKKPHFLERVTSASRVLIIEGISGSGKDMFQLYLRNSLRDRHVYDYSEGELLQSWKQLQIEGILKIRVKFMSLFVNYIENTISQDANSVFLLNRFHLSAYASTIVKQPKLEREYNEIINNLRKLAAHVFILRLEENEMAKRSAHPERSVAWEKHQEQITRKEGFRDPLARHIWQQELILEAAARQRIPYTVIRITVEKTVEAGNIRVHQGRNIYRRGVRMHRANPKLSRHKRQIPEPL